MTIIVTSGTSKNQNTVSVSKLHPIDIEYEISSNINPAGKRKNRIAQDRNSILLIFAFLIDQRYKVALMPGRPNAKRVLYRVPFQGFDIIYFFLFMVFLFFKIIIIL